jgi:hypothetical protein
MARVQVELRHAGQTVTIEVDDTTLWVYNQRNDLIKNVTRTSRKEVCRYKALWSHHQPHNRLGTITHHQKANGIHHLGPTRGSGSGRSGTSPGTRHRDARSHQARNAQRVKALGEGGPPHINSEQTRDEARYRSPPRH